MPAIKSSISLRFLEHEVEKEVFRFLEEFSECQYTFISELLEWKIENLIFKLLLLLNYYK